MTEIKKYKQGRKLTKFICKQCGNEADKPTSEFNRNVKLGRNNFCSRSCAISYSNSHRKTSEKSKQHLAKLNKNKIDEFTPFRYTFRNAKKRFKEFNLTLEQLKETWENQKGICPYTKVQLILPRDGHPVEDTTIRASLDRIDSSKGYIAENIQFVSTNINYMKNTLSDSELKNFLNLITSNLSLDKD